MPFYEYQCQACGAQVEVLQKISDAPLRKCPECGKSRLKKLVSAPVFRLKGGGWYETDFKSEGENKRNLVEAEKSGDDKAGAKPDDQAGSKPAEKPAEKQAEKPAEKPAEKSAVTPPGKPRLGGKVVTGGAPKRRPVAPPRKPAARGKSAGKGSRK